MSELELLFLVLALIYGCECACWVPAGSVAFRTWLGGRWWRPAYPGTLLSNQRGGFLFAHPLPPLGTLLTANQFPLSFSTDALFAFVAPAIDHGRRPAHTGKFFRFTDLQKVEANGKKVQANGALLVKAPSSAYAEHLALQIRQLIKAPPAGRAAALRKLVRASLDVKALEHRWQEYRKLTGGLRLLTNGLFLFLFVAAPLLIRQLGLALCWPGLVAVLLAFAFSAALLFRRAHKSLYPAAQDERFTHFLTILLSPATTIRAQDVLSRPLLETFHPLAIARVFCSLPVFTEFAWATLREVRHPSLPLCPVDDPVAQEAERQGRLRWLEAVEEFLEQEGFDLDQLAKSPAAADRTCRSYCPRCLAQFKTSEGVCDDCGGLRRVAFPPDATKWKNI